MLSLRPIKREPEHETSAWSDLKAFFKEKQEYRWLILAASVAIPLIMIWAFFHDSSFKQDYKAPEITFFKSWNNGRTDAEVKAQQAIDAPQERADRKEIHDAEEARKASFRRIADQMGIEVDK
jgi:hypothetical protein